MRILLKTIRAFERIFFSLVEKIFEQLNAKLSLWETLDIYFFKA